MAHDPSCADIHQGFNKTDDPALGMTITDDQDRSPSTRRPPNNANVGLWVVAESHEEVFTKPNSRDGNIRSTFHFFFFFFLVVDQAAECDGISNSFLPLLFHCDAWNPTQRLRPGQMDARVCSISERDWRPVSLVDLDLGMSAPHEGDRLQIGH
jgi:hypothetical protein